MVQPPESILTKILCDTPLFLPQRLKRTLYQPPFAGIFLVFTEALFLDTD
jgi:hypothetical protein